MSSSNDCRPPEAKGSDDDLWGLEILLVEDSQSVADALKQRTKVPTPTRLHDGLMVAMVSTFKGSDLKMKK